MNTIKEVLKDLAHLKLPVTATAAAALIVTLLPGVDIKAEVVAAVLVVVGLAASFVQKLIEKKQGVK